MRPEWLYDVAAAVMLAVAAHGATLVAVGARARRRTGLDVAVSHLAMGVAMAGMLVSGLAVGPDAAWELVFAALAAWFVARAVGPLAVRGRPVPHTAVHAVMAAAMLLMYRLPRGTVMAAGSAGAPAHLGPGIGSVLAVVLLASAVSTLASPGGGRAMYAPRPAQGVERWATSPGPAWVAAPKVGDAAHAAMAVGMAFTLIVMR